MKSNRIISMLVLMAMLFALVGVIPAFAATVFTLTLNAPTTAPAIGVPFTVDVVANATSPIRVIQFDLQYDPAVLRLDSVTPKSVWKNGAERIFTCTGPSGPITITTDFIVSGDTTTPGLLDAFVSSPFGVPNGYGCTGSGVIATLQFTPLANGRSVNQFLQVIIPDANNTALPPAAPGIDGYEALAASIRVGPGPNVGASVFSASLIGTGPTFEVTFTPSNTGTSPSDPTPYRIDASNTVEGFVTGTIPAFTGATGTPIVHTFTLAGTATQSTLNLSFSEFPANNRQIIFVSGVNEEGDVPVDATFLAFLDLTVPSSIDFGYLALGANSVNSSLNVKCNTNYAVDVTSARNFHMTQWDGTNYGAASLFSAMQVVSAQNIVTAPALPNGSRLLVGNPAGQVQDLGQTFLFYLSQVLTYQDPVLPTGQTYHDLLTFNAYVTF